MEWWGLADLFLVTRSACSPTAADTVLILKHAVKSNSAVSNGSLTSSNQSFHQLLCLRSAWSKNSNGKTILACLILAENLHDTPTSYTDLPFPATPNPTLYCVRVLGNSCNCPSYCWGFWLKVPFHSKRLSAHCYVTWMFELHCREMCVQSFFNSSVEVRKCLCAHLKSQFKAWMS